MAHDPNVCALCERPIQKEAIKKGALRIPLYWCSHCFFLYKHEILSREPWTRMLANLEKQRRKRRNGRQKYGFVFLPLKEELLSGE